jgi:hypothetical protein
MHRHQIVILTFFHQDQYADDKIFHPINFQRYINHHHRNLLMDF